MTNLQKLQQAFIENYRTVYGQEITEEQIKSKWSSIFDATRATAKIKKECKNMEVLATRDEDLILAHYRATSSKNTTPALDPWY